MFSTGFSPAVLKEEDTAFESAMLSLTAYIVEKLSTEIQG